MKHRWTLLLTLIVVPFQFAQAKNFDVLWSFKGPAQQDGAFPYNSLMSDSVGNLLGTTTEGGALANGTIFKLAPDGSETVLYSFKGGNDGAGPESALIADSAGNLYGTTKWGGTGTCGVGCGTVFKLAPDGTETVLHSFQDDGNDGFYPLAGLIRDQAGNLYGTTQAGGTADYGTVFEITAGGSEKVLHSFTGADGQYPYYGSLVMDNSGNLYGTTGFGGQWDGGTIFKVSPDGTETVLHSCNGSAEPSDCMNPFGGLSMDQRGNLYGTSEEGGYAGEGDGAVFKVTPDGSFTMLYAFTDRKDGRYPLSGVIPDQAGNLYGTTVGSAGKPCKGCATVFRLAPDGTETVLHRFNYKSKGLYPQGLLTLDGNGYLYGTTIEGGVGESGKDCAEGRHGPTGCGTVFRLNTGAK